jgi:hypothetical protein
MVVVSKATEVRGGNGAYLGSGGDSLFELSYGGSGREADGEGEPLAAALG